MTDDCEGDDELADLIADYDERLAAGITPTQPPSTIRDVSPDLRDRLARAEECLQLLESVWPRRNTPNSELPESIGRFRVLRQLGIGGFGTVFLADDPQLNRQVALKVPHVVWLLSKKGHQHFLREAEAAARVNHPNIIAVYEVGEAGPLTYIASEYCHGPSLATWLAARAQVTSIREAAQLVAKLARAMQHAHVRGVLHRDLKPSNVLLSCSLVDSLTFPDSLSEFTPKIADFGLAKLVEQSHDRTRTGAIIGTLEYLAPEQAEGRVSDISAQTDIYALGAILYELLTGSTPNCGRTDADTLKRILLVETASPRRLRAEIPADLAAICLKCLEKAPERRYTAAADLADDLERFYDGRPTKVSPIGITQRAWRWAKRRPALAGLTAFSVTAMFILVGGTVLYNTRLQLARNQVEKEVTTNSELLYTAKMRLATEAWQAGHVAQAVDILSSLVPAPGQRDLREFTWHYLWNVTHCEIYTLEGHKGDVYHVSVSPDGKSLASAGKDGIPRLWDLSTGALIRSFEGHRDEVNAVLLTHGNLLASAGDDGLVNIWDTRTGRRTLSLEANDGAVTALAVSDNRRLLASGGAACQIHLWDLESGALLWTSPASTAVDTLAFSADARSLVSGHKDGTTRWWSVDGRQLIHAESSFKDWAASVAFSAVFPEVAVAGRTGFLRTYRRNASGWREKASAALNSKAGGIYAVAYSPRDNTLATGSRDGLIELWHPGPKLTRCGDLPGHKDRIWCVTWSPDGRLLASASADGTVKVWNVPQSAGLVKRYPRLSAPICAIAVSPNSQSILSGTVDGRIHEWDRKTRQVREILDDNWSGFTGACYLGDPHLAVATGPHSKFRRFNLESGAVQLSSGDEAVLPCSIAISGDDSVLAVGCEHQIAYLFDGNSGAVRHRLTARALDVHCVALTRDARTLATAGVGAEIELWDAHSGERTFVLPGHDGRVLSLAFSPDGTTLFSGGSDHTIRRWEASSGRLIATLIGQSGPVSALAISPDGRTLASASNSSTSLRTWDLITNEPMQSLTNLSNSVQALAFTPDGKDLIAGCGDSDGVLMEWQSVGSGEMPATDIRRMKQPLRLMEKFAKHEHKHTKEASRDSSLGSVDMLQAVNEHARRSGFLIGYPTFRTTADREHATVEVVLLRGVGITKNFVMLDDFHDVADIPRADHETQDALLSGLFSSVDRWSREVSYLGVLPTCFADVNSNEAPAYEIGLLYGSRFSRLRIDLDELDDLGDVKSTFQRVHAHATKAGYASAFPTFNVIQQQLECVAIRAGSAEVVEIPKSELILEAGH